MQIKQIHFTHLLALLCLFITITGCNNTDDVDKIFTGKTWRLTYITRADEHHWYLFPGVDRENCEAYHPRFGSSALRLQFTGDTHEGIIQGDFVVNGGVEMKGTWMANGKTNQFQLQPKSSNVVKPSDMLGKEIENALKRAKSYSGDEYNLYLYYDYRVSSAKTEELTMVFSLER